MANPCGVTSSIWRSGRRTCWAYLRLKTTRTQCSSGVSLGAQLAIHLASYQADQVKGLVLIAPVFEKALKGSVRWARSLRPVIALLVGIIRRLDWLGLYRRRLPSRDLRALDEKMRTTLLTPGQYEEMIDRYSSPWPHSKVFPTANFIQEIMQMVRSLPLLSSTKVPVPTLLSRGATYTDPDRSREMMMRIPDVKIVPIGAYHWPLTERPVEVRQTIESWCAGLARISYRLSQRGRVRLQGWRR